MGECPLVHIPCGACGHEIREDGMCGCEDKRHPIGPGQVTVRGRLANEVNRLHDGLPQTQDYVYIVPGMRVWRIEWPTALGHEVWEVGKDVVRLRDMGRTYRRTYHGDELASTREAALAAYRECE